MKVLFLCTANSCRSILSEAIFNALSPKGMRAFSAGSHPKGEVNPLALRHCLMLGTMLKACTANQPMPIRLSPLTSSLPSATRQPERPAPFSLGRQLVVTGG